MKILIPFLVGLVIWIFTGDTLIAASLLVLILAWQLLQPDEGPPVLALAVTMQWVAVTIGLFYVRLTGRPLEATLNSDYETMVYIGLGWVLALTAGLWLGRWLLARLKPLKGDHPPHAMSFKTVVLCYVGGVTVVGVVQQIAWEYPSVTQAIIAVTYLRLGLLYLLMRWLVLAARWDALAGLLLFEIALGLTGFFAGFREPLMMAVLTLLEVFNRRTAHHWFSIAALGTAMCVLGVMWVSVRGDYRARFFDEEIAASRSERLDSLRSAAGNWAAQDTADLLGNTDAFVDRLWAIYYPALAIERVPNVIPHTDGRLMSGTLEHIFKPRIFFPDKPELISDSELVRKYSGVLVAGADQGTTIAFGYATESYVDYGIPGMFVPAFIFGMFMGMVYGGILHGFRHRDIAIAVVTVTCWLSLYLFERSWAKTLGLAGTLVIYVGAITYIFDRFWYERFRNEQVTDWGQPPQFVDHEA